MHCGQHAYNCDKIKMRIPAITRETHFYEKVIHEFLLLTKHKCTGNCLLLTFHQQKRNGKKWKRPKRKWSKNKNTTKKKSQRQAILDIGNRLLNKTKAKNKKNIKKIKCYHSSLDIPLHVRLFTKQGFCVWTHSHTHARIHTHIHVVVKCFSSSKS